MKKELYGWQKTVMTVFGFITSIAIFYNDHYKNSGGGSGFRWDLLLDLVTAIGLNVLILWIVFKLCNWIYRKAKNSKL